MRAWSNKRLSAAAADAMVKQPSAAMNAVTAMVNEPVGEVDVAGA